MIKNEKKGILFFGNIIFLKYYLFFYIILLFSLFKKYRFLPKFSYPFSINLLNGNVFILHKDGFVVYDSSLKYEIKNKTINNLINEDILSKIEISSFSPIDDGYIICLINNKIFFFDWEGNYLSQSEESQLDGNCYTLIPIKKKNSEYFYMIGFIKGKIIHLKFFKYNKDSISNNNIILRNVSLDYLAISNTTYNPENYEILDNTLTCQLMKDIYGEEIIVCFFNIKNSSQVIKITNFFINITTFNIYDSLKSNIIIGGGKDTKVMKSSSNFEKTKSFVCFSYADPPNECIIYSIEGNNFEEKRGYNVSCGRDKLYNLKLYFVRETNHTLFFCYLDGTLTMAILDYDLNKIDNYEYYQTNIEGISIIYSYNLSNYNAILYPTESNNHLSDFKINTSITINATKPIDNLTEYIHQLNQPEKSEIMSTIFSTSPFENSLYTTNPTSEQFISSSDPYEKNTDTIILTTYSDKVSESAKESYISTIISSNTITESAKESYISTIISSNLITESTKESYISTIIFSHSITESVKESYISTIISSNTITESTKESYISTILSSNIITEYIESNLEFSETGKSLFESTIFS